MKLPHIAVLMVAVAVTSLTGSHSTPVQSKGAQAALMCFKVDERVSGMNKICTYNCAGSEAAITVKSHELCPLNINR
jgi:hypothetical protein